MTIRDIGASLENLWDRILSDLQIVVSSSPLDWPIWVFPAGFVLIVFIIPIALGKIIKEVRLYIETEPPMGLGWCLGFTIGTVLSAMVLVDLHVTKAVYTDSEPAPIFLYIAYPIMTAFFGFSAFVEWRKQIQVWRNRNWP